MNKYLSGSTIYPLSINDSECMIQCRCDGMYKLNISRGALSKIFQNSFVSIFDQIQIPLGNDKYEIDYTISNHYIPLILHQKNIMNIIYAAYISILI